MRRKKINTTENDLLTHAHIHSFVKRARSHISMQRRVIGHFCVLHLPREHNMFIAWSAKRGAALVGRKIIHVLYVFQKKILLKHFIVNTTFKVKK